MKKTIGIVAPVINSEVFLNFDFTTKIYGSAELILKNIYHLIQNNYDLTRLPKQYDEAELYIPSGGYYLSGLLRLHGYDTILTKKITTFSLDKIAKTDPLAICVSSTMISKYQDIGIIVEKIRSVMPETPIIIGGVYIWKSYKFINFIESDPEINNTIFKNEKKQLFIFPCNRNTINCDIFIVSPYGGDILLQVLKELQVGNACNFEHIPNIAIPDSKGNFYFTKRIKEEINVENDFIQWNLLDELPARVSIRSSIGCPYRCKYCDFWHLYPKVYMRSTRSILKELALLQRHPYFNNQVLIIHYTDDNIFINQNRINEICNAMIESGINRSWGGFIRSTSINHNNIDLIKKSKFMFAYVGVESGDQNMVDRMNRNQKLNDMKMGIELLDSVGINSILTFVVGFPGENNITVDNTINFLNNLNIKTGYTSYELLPFFVAPLSTVSTLEERKKWMLSGLYDKWSHSTMKIEEVSKIGYKIFKNVDYIPYAYLESFLFNSRFSTQQRKRLYKLRQLLTIQVIEKVQLTEVQDTFAEICKVIELKKKIPSSDFIEKLNVGFNVEFKK